MAQNGLGIESSRGRAQDGTRRAHLCLLTATAALMTVAWFGPQVLGAGIGHDHRTDVVRVAGLRAATSSEEVFFEGSCDASGAVPLTDHTFAVADDEDNVIRVYDALRGGPPVQHTNLSPRLALQRKGESDIEAATSANGRAFWLSSHARNSKGAVDPNRSLLITTELPTLGAHVELRGQVYRRLLEDLQQTPELARYELVRAAELGPKEPGGLNLEGLTATPNSLVSTPRTFAARPRI